jgi:hypothetical protein
VDGADKADFLAVTLDARGLARVQGWMLAGDEAEVAPGHRQPSTASTSAFTSKKSTVSRPWPSLPAGGCRKRHRRASALLQVFQLTDEAQAAFEQAHAVLLTVQVVLQRLDQARPQRGAHGGHVVGDRVGQQQRLNAWIEQFELLRVDEAVGDRFLVTTGNQQATQVRQLAAGSGLACGARRACG